MKSQKELVGASTALLVLGILAKEANYGYQVVKCVNQEAENLFEWQEGTIYPVLHKLELDKLLRTQWQQADSGRKRKYYYITQKGREALEKRAEQWSAFNSLVNRIVEMPNG
jgi:DNA-binding PadR family transcriptional regulator